MDIKNHLDSLKKKAEAPKTPKPTEDPGAGNKWVIDGAGNWKQVPLATESYEIEKSAAIDDLLFDLADGAELSNEDFGSNLEGFVSDGLIQEVLKPESLNAQVSAKLNTDLKFYAATKKLYDVLEQKISSFENELKEKEITKIAGLDIAKLVREAAMKSIILNKKNIVINARTRAVLGTFIRQSKNGIEVNKNGKISVYWPQEIA